MRNGNFSAFGDHYDASQICDETDPNRPHLQLHNLAGQPYPLNKITDPFDPRATAILKFYPLPIQGGHANFANNNHTLNVPNPILSDQFDIRIDHTINSKQNVFGRWTYKNKRLVSPSQNDLGLPAEQDFEHDNQIVLAYNYAITPNMIIELRGGISRMQYAREFHIDYTHYMYNIWFNPLNPTPFHPRSIPH